MRIVLINCPAIIYSIRRFTLPDEPLGLLSLASMIKTDHDVLLIDGYAGHLPIQEIIKKSINFMPHVIGLSCLFSSQIPAAIHLAEEIKKENKNVQIVIGGNPPTFLRQYLINYDCVDAIILHEGEISFANYLKFLEGKIEIDNLSGILYKNGGSIYSCEETHLVEDLDKIPFPARKLLSNINGYNKNMCTSRGCPFNCIYCSTKKMWGKWRARSAQNVVDEIIEIVGDFNPEYISFVDDTFAVSKGRIIEIGRLLKLNNIKVKLGGSVRIEQITEDFIKLLSEIGFKGLFLGVESGSNKILKQLKRNYSAEDVLKKVDICVKYGIIPQCSFIIGFPFETREDVMETLKLMRKVNTYKVQANWFMYFPGTDVFDKYKDYGVIMDPQKMNLLRYNPETEMPIIKTPFLSAEEIMDFYHEALGIIREKAFHKWRYQEHDSSK